LLLGLLVCAGLFGCNNPTTTLPGDLASPQALAVSGNELFIASTNTDELRVLELSTDVTARTFASAPNPIYVLSVPVVTRPVALPADTDGVNTGKYLLVLSAVSNRLGIVDVSKKVEVQEVALPGTPLSVAARTLNDGGARVYMGISNGRHGSIVTVD